ncbi:hypothetical protein HOLleu_21264 [Holothuria leucospilota]|uniref:Ig-like domain-containing protein n=1 Tax=Holothuria leucospilota TaxID=206669 RepID=A0A9Q1BXG7_HOLLE|nr:hypothetical protein HOLleu_21264 [Holothuria leucospilota]
MGAKPPANLTRVIDNEVAHSSKVSYSTSENMKQHTSDSIAVLDIPNAKPRMNISCHTSIDEIHSNHNSTMITIMSEIQTNPLLIVGINGRNYTSDSLVALRENAAVYCYAVGARPPANLTWIIDEVAHSSKVFYSTSENKKKQHTYDSIAVLNIPNDKPKINASCHTSIFEIHGNHKNTMITIILEIQEKGCPKLGRLSVSRGCSAGHEYFKVPEYAEDNLYLLSEYLNCTTLNDSLTAASRVHLATKNVLTYIIHILQGIEFLQAYGENKYLLRNPLLSTALKE